MKGAKMEQSQRPRGHHKGQLLPITNGREGRS